MNTNGWVGLLVTAGWASLAGLGCGSQVARETGTIQGRLSWSGAWPAEGAMLVVLFDVPPWDPDFEPGPPAAFTILARPDDGQPAAYEIANPGVPFGTYGSLTAAWQDPTAGSQSEHMRPVAIWGSSLEQPEMASPVDLGAAEPDLQIDFEPVELFSAAEDMRAHYPPVVY